MTHHIKIEVVAQAGSTGAKLKVSPRVLRANIGDTIVWDGVGGKPEIAILLRREFGLLCRRRVAGRICRGLAAVCFRVH